MRQIWLVVLLVSFLAAIGPSFAWSETIGEVRGEMPGPQVIVEIDADKMQFQGNGAWWLRQNLAAMLRNRLDANGIVRIAVTGRQFESIAKTQDRIHESGRYSEASRLRVPLGEMEAPDVQFQLTGIANISREDHGGSLSFSLSGQRYRMDQRRIKATVRLVAEPIGISSGLNLPGFEVRGEASRTIDRRISAGSYGNFGTGGGSASNVEPELLNSAASQAIDQLVRQFAKMPPIVESQPEAVLEPTAPPANDNPDPVGIERTGLPEIVTDRGARIPISITSGKTVNPGDSVIFYNRQGERLAKYLVTGGAGGQVRAATIMERNRPGKGDPFQIVRPVVTPGYDYLFLTGPNREVAVRLSQPLKLDQQIKILSGRERIGQLRVINFDREGRRVYLFGDISKVRPGLQYVPF